MAIRCACWGLWGNGLPVDANDPPDVSDALAVGVSRTRVTRKEIDRAIVDRQLFGAVVTSSESRRNLNSFPGSCSRRDYGPIRLTLVVASAHGTFVDGEDVERVPSPIDKDGPQGRFRSVHYATKCVSVESDHPPDVKKTMPVGVTGRRVTREEIDGPTVDS